MPFGFFVVVFCLESQIAVWALIRMRASQIIIQVTEFLRNFQVFLGIQQPKNYRFDCEFVLKNYSNWPIPCILNSFCQMFEKHAPHGAINSLRNGLVVPSNRLRISRLAFRIIRVSFLGVNKLRLFWITFWFRKAFCLLSVLFFRFLLTKRDNCIMLRILRSEPLLVSKIYYLT